MVFEKIKRTAGYAGLCAALAFAAPVSPAAAAPHGQPTPTTITPALAANLAAQLSSEGSQAGEIQVAQRRRVHRGPRGRAYRRGYRRGFRRGRRASGPIVRPGRRYYRGGKRYYGGPRYYRRGYGPGAAVAAGAIGLAAGAIAGAAIAAPPRGRAVVIDPVPAPYTAEWYRRCSLKYRSFRASDGTFLGYDGIRKICRLP